MPTSIYWDENGGVFALEELRNCWKITRGRNQRGTMLHADPYLDGLEPINGANQQQLQKKALIATRNWLARKKARLDKLTAKLETLNWEWTEKHAMTNDRTRNCYAGVLNGVRYKKTIITDDYGTEPKTIYTHQGKI